MRVLVTGANGFLGSHVAERLARQGHDLRLLLRPTSDLTFLQGLSYERAEGDVRDPESLLRAAKGVDGVVHVAGLTNARNEQTYMAVNDAGTRAAVDAALETGARRFVYVSSAAAQGPGRDGRDMRPDDRPRPVSAYGRSKLAGEMHVLEAADRMSVAIIRPPVIYGPRDRALLPFYVGMRLRVIPMFGRGRNRLSWVHARDAADAIVCALAAEGPSGAVYTIDDGGAYTWHDLISVLAAVIGRRPLRVPVPPVLYFAAGHIAGFVSRFLPLAVPLNAEKVVEMSQASWVCGHEQITLDLGWQPRIGAREGIEETLRWYREQRWLLARATAETARNERQRARPSPPATAIRRPLVR